MNTIKSVSSSIGLWIGSQLSSVPHRDLGWLRRKLVMKMTAWKDGFEVFDGPGKFTWLNHEWMIQFGAVRGVICKIGLTCSCDEEKKEILKDVGMAIQSALGNADRLLSRPAEGAMLWQGHDGTVILQEQRGFVVVYFTSITAIHKAMSV